MAPKLLVVAVAFGCASFGAPVSVHAFELPPECEGAPENPNAVSDACGVFVNPAAGAGGAGTRASPVRTLGEAIAQVAGKAPQIFVCLGKTTETATVALADIRVVGGFACGDWSWQPTLRSVIGGAADNPTVAASGTHVALRQINLSSPAAVAPGGSSIGLISASGSLTLADVGISVGSAQAGSNAAPVLNSAALNGLRGRDGIDACGPGAQHPGGASQTVTCPVNGSSSSGAGGYGSTSVALAGGAGGNGTPARLASFGTGGTGEGSTLCTDGADGAPGLDGDPAAALPIDAIGSVNAGGYRGIDGLQGLPGYPGQGGGGGGGSKGAASVTCGSMTLSVAGASGGSGGTGGCGGVVGGRGGKAGGSSIALILLGSSLESSNVQLVRSVGGGGGAGGRGQLGGQYGIRGTKGIGAGAAEKACNGGDGGLGGNAGSGGGGAGGHSVGIAYEGYPPDLTGVTFAPTNATPAAGGLGGPGNETAGKGPNGKVQDVMAFNLLADGFEDPPPAQ